MHKCRKLTQHVRRLEALHSAKSDKDAAQGQPAAAQVQGRCNTSAAPMADQGCPAEAAEPSSAASRQDGGCPKAAVLPAVAGLMVSATESSNKEAAFDRIVQGTAAHQQPADGTHGPASPEQLPLNSPAPAAEPAAAAVMAEPSHSSALAQHAQSADAAELTEVTTSNHMLGDTRANVHCPSMIASCRMVYLILCSAMQGAAGVGTVRLPFSADRHSPAADRHHHHEGGGGGGDGRKLHGEIVELRKAVIAAQLQCACRTAASVYLQGSHMTHFALCFCCRPLWPCAGVVPYPAAQHNRMQVRE